MQVLDVSYGRPGSPSDQSPTRDETALSDRQHANGREVSLQSREIIGVVRVNDSAATQCCRRHHDGIGQRCTAYRTEGFTGSTTKARRHSLDEHGVEDLFAIVVATSPPFDMDGRRNNAQKTPSHDGAEGFPGRTLAPLQRNEHSRVEGERHAARRRFFLGAPSPRQSASMRSAVSSSSGGIAYFSKSFSAARNLASRSANSARRADTFPL